jgi:hypothetical protein
MQITGDGGGSLVIEVVTGVPRDEDVLTGVPRDGDADNE